MLSYPSCFLQGHSFSSVPDTLLQNWLLLFSARGKMRFHLHSASNWSASWSTTQQMGDCFTNRHENQLHLLELLHTRYFYNHLWTLFSKATFLLSPVLIFHITIVLLALVPLTITCTVLKPFHLREGHFILFSLSTWHSWCGISHSTFKESQYGAVVKYLTRSKGGSSHVQ